MQLELPVVNYTRRGATAPGGPQGLLIFEISRSHTVTLHSVGLLWTGDRPDSHGPLPDNTQHSQEIYIHASRRDSNP